MTQKAQNPARTVLRLAGDQKILRARDLDPLGIPRAYLKRLIERGELVRLSRGLYALPDYQPSEHGSLATIGKRCPKAVVCLLSALRYHDLTTQNPFQVWIMIHRTARVPNIAYPPLRIVRASGRALDEGVEKRQVDEVAVRVTRPAKTVADCFRYRSKVGTDVAIEALRDCWRQRKATMDELHRFAQIDRVANVMRPYLESLV
jgi:predicted transcriptional regulator of viral defense system